MAFRSATFLLPALFVFSLGRSSYAAAACEGASDLAEAAHASLVADAQCPCDDYDGGPGKTHGLYVKCVQTQLNELAALNTLSEACLAKLKKDYAKSVCGFKPELNKEPCLKYIAASDKLKCSIKPTTKKDGTTPTGACKDSSSSTGSSCAGYKRCVDAGDDNHDGVLGAGDSGDCSDAVPANLPSNFPRPSIPPDGTSAPSAPDPGAAYCDYYNCYTYNILDSPKWSAAPRAGSPSATPQLPIDSVTPPDPPTPFRSSEYCDVNYCYDRSLAGSWSSSYRFGSESVAQTVPDSTSFCGLHHCYELESGSWTSNQIDLAGVGLPPAQTLPDLTPAPTNQPTSGSMPSFCDSGYCYAKNHFGVWYSEYQPPTCGTASKCVFVTAASFSPNFGGAFAADAACQAAADAGSTTLDGKTFKAWISDGVTSPLARFAQAAVPYALLDGTVIASNWTDLTDGTLSSAIDLDENGSARTSNIWSNTLTTGAADNGFANAFSDSCAGWDNTLAASGRKGLANQTDSTWTSSGTAECSEQLALYCFQQ